ncbi:MAG: hypothetical protein ACFE0K_08465 [Alcanivorax sp.]|uniref:hypothetical protein n=1 Tax=Alcanivorax sp. TaxID=1872427 RepID=UPI003DA6F050
MAMLPQIDTHYREAMAFFQRRCRLLNAPASPLEALRQLDWRLATNLDAVAIYQEGKPEASLRPSALFVETWVGQQRDSARCQEGLDGMFSALKPEQQGAVMLAMNLSRYSVGVKHPELRAALMSEQTALAISEDEVAEHDALLAKWLRFQDATGVDISRFQPWYQNPDFPRSRRSALQAGLVRRDPQATQIARDYQDEPVFALLLALAGHPPKSLLGQAFCGSVSAARHLLDALDQVARCEDAAQAWFWLCGEMAPRKPRLQAVGEGDGSSRETLPDAAAATQRWEARQWQDGARYFFGEPVSDSSLAALGKKWTGQIAPLIAAQQSWLAGRCVLPATGWQFHSPSEGDTDA